MGKEKSLDFIAKSWFFIEESISKNKDYENIYDVLYEVCDKLMKIENISNQEMWNYYKNYLKDK